MRKRLLHTCILVALCGVSAFSQDDVRSSIRVMASAQRDSVILRWAPTTAMAWKFLNEYGYRIDRYTIVRDSAVLAQKPMTALSGLIKPAGQSSWMPHMDNDMVAIMAECIFGEELQVVGRNSLFQMKNKSDELSSRFSYSIVASDVSPIAATLGGLRFVDRDVKKNERYLYRVYSLVPESILPIEYGYAYIGPSEVFALPVPRHVEASVRSNIAFIQYDANPLKAFYSAYFIERADSVSKEFKKLSTFPTLPLHIDTLGNQIIISTDSLAKNDWRYQYRVKGITPFGEIGPPSDPVTVKNFVSISIYSPRITDMIVTPRSSVKLSWEIRHGQALEISGFDVLRSASEQGEFLKVNSRMLAQSTREFEDSKPLPANYYKIVAFAKNGKQKAESFPYLIQLEDSIPPSAPVEVMAKIDTASIVHLSWKANDERDLVGYRVYFSNFKNAEFGQITTDPVAAPEFIDTLSSKTLSRKAYYKITAIDNRFNTSIFSQVIEVTRPDKVPPVAPVFTRIRSDKDGVTLNWIRSTSDDVVKHVLYRRCGKVSSWTEIKSFTTDSTFIDKQFDPLVTCAYKLVAIDEAGLQSPAGPMVTAKTPASSKKNIKDVQASADRVSKRVLLRWELEEVGVSKYQIYRAESEEPVSLYKVIAGNKNEFVDDKLKMNTSYTYYIKAIFSDGTESSFSEKVKIKY